MQMIYGHFLKQNKQANKKKPKTYTKNHGLLQLI